MNDTKERLILMNIPKRLEQKRKYWLRLALGILIWICGWNLVAEAGTIEVVFHDQDIRYTLFTLYNGQAEFVHVNKIAEIFQIAAETDPIDGHVTFSSGVKTASFFPGKNEVIAARRSYTLEIAPLKIEGVIMVPLEFLTKILPLIYTREIIWEPGSRRFVVGSENPEILQISTLSAIPSSEYTQITAEFSQGASYKVTEKLPSMLIFEFPQATFDLAQNPLQINSRSVKHVSVVDSFGSTQIIVRLGNEFVRYEHQMSKDPAHWVLKVYHGPKTPDTTQPVEGLIEANLVAPEQPGFPASEPKPYVLRTVVLDPGHGGSDLGVIILPATDDTPALYEKHVTLQIAKSLKTNLTQRLGVRVILTREVDEFISAEDRATLANSNRADIFISLHVNKSFTAGMVGFEAYVMDYGSLEQPNGSNLLSGRSQLLDFAQANYVTQSERLAQHIVAAYQARYPGSRAEVEYAPLFTLKGTTMPALHLEVGYGSNAQDQQNITGEVFQQSLVAAISDGIAGFKKEQTP
ncbi:cell wall hydrolase/autolysin [Candidatus Vecturithrix granuli]|uniref:Cell wall hydrolase/autolysin n=1 Tax=Vecturithrix granuli TaxID=1499967 RepID=A0A0S6W5N5_VECG1|nr:cell wall hydrolase/autolysin [Candidatus Vecturithrix granuli]